MIGSKPEMEKNHGKSVPGRQQFVQRLRMKSKDDEGHICQGGLECLQCWKTWGECGKEDMLDCMCNGSGRVNLQYLSQRWRVNGLW